MADPTPAQVVVDINCGGSHYTTSAATISRFPSNLGPFPKSHRSREGDHPGMGCSARGDGNFNSKR